jgi:S1-C subfamily serine protease
MNRPRTRAPLIGLLLAWAVAPLLSAPANLPPPPAGVIVEKPTPGFEAARVGIQPGDVLLSWDRGANPPVNPKPASGLFRST